VDFRARRHPTLNKALLLGDIAGPTLFSVIGTPPRKGGTWRVPPARGPSPSVLTPGGRTGTPTPLAGEKVVSVGEGDQARHRGHSWLLFLPFSAVIKQANVTGSALCELCCGCGPDLKTLGTWWSAVFQRYAERRSIRSSWRESRHCVHVRWVMCWLCACVSTRAPRCDVVVSRPHLLHSSPVFFDFDNNFSRQYPELIWAILESACTLVPD